MFQGKTLAKGHQTGKGSGKAAQSVEVAEVTDHWGPRVFGHWGNLAFIPSEMLYIWKDLNRRVTSDLGFKTSRWLLVELF